MCASISTAIPGIDCVHVQSSDTFFSDNHTKHGLSASTVAFQDETVYVHIKMHDCKYASFGSERKVNTCNIHDTIKTNNK